MTTSRRPIGKAGGGGRPMPPRLCVSTASTKPSSTKPSNSSRPRRKTAAYWSPAAAGSYTSDISAGRTATPTLTTLRSANPTPRSPSESSWRSGRNCFPTGWIRRCSRGTTSRRSYSPCATLGWKTSSSASSWPCRRACVATTPASSTAERSSSTRPVPTAGRACMIRS